MSRRRRAHADKSPANTSKLNASETGRETSAGAYALASRSRISASPSVLAAHSRIPSINSSRTGISRHSLRLRSQQSPHRVSPLNQQPETMTMKTDDKRKRVLKDGEVLHVPMYFMDGVQRALASRVT